MSTRCYLRMYEKLQGIRIYFILWGIIIVDIVICMALSGSGAEHALEKNIRLPPPPL